MNIHGAAIYWKQGTGAAVSSVRCVWAGAGMQHEYSWCPQLLELPEARRTWRCRPDVKRVWAGAGPQRAARTGVGHVVAASHLQLVTYALDCAYT